MYETRLRINQTSSILHKRLPLLGTWILSRLLYEKLELKFHRVYNNLIRSKQARNTKTKTLNPTTLAR
jgi:hypothetical protein